MDLVDNSTYLIEKVVQEVKSQGLFDQFRKECISDVDTKPAYQNLKKRVDTNVQNFLDQQEWQRDSNRNQMREKLRKHIAESSFLATGVERIVDQVVNPKISTIFLPKIEEVVYQFLGIEKPIHDDKQNFTNSNFLNIKTEEVHLLPNDLEAVSPDSSKSNKSINNSTENLNDSFYEPMNESADKMEEFESPAFEPLEGLGSELVVNKEESNDSHLSNISGLTSQDSVNSEKDLNESTPVAENQMDTANNDSQLSQVSSNSHLSIVTKSESTSPKMDISEDTQMSSHMNGSLQEKIDIISKFDVKIEETSENSVEMKEDIKEIEKDLIKDDEVFVAEPVTDVKEEPSVKPEIILEPKEEIKEMLKESETIQLPAETIIETIQPLAETIIEEQPLKDENKKMDEESKIETKPEPEIKIKMEDEIKIGLEEELHTKVEEEIKLVVIEEIKPVVDEEIKIKLDEDVIIGNSSTNDSIKSDETLKDKNIKDCTKTSPKTSKSSDDKSRSRYSSDKSKDRHKSSSSSSRHHSSSSNSRDDKKSYRSDDRKKDDTPRKDDKSRRDDRKRSDDRTSSHDRHRSKSDSKSSRDKSRSDKDKRDSSSKYSSKGSSSKNDSRSRETDRHRRSDHKDRKDKSSERPSSSNENKSKDRLVDDHYSSKDKINEKRRSTDRDSNDGSNSGSSNFVNKDTVKKTETTTAEKSNSTTSPSNSSTSTSSQDKTEAAVYVQSNVKETEMAVPMTSQPIVFNSSNMGANTCLELVIGPDSKMNDFNILKKKPKTIIVPSDDEEDLHYFPEEKQIFKENVSLLNYVNKMKAEHEVYQKTAYLLDCDEVYMNNFKDTVENVIEIKGDDQIQISKVNEALPAKSDTSKTNSLENKDANKRQRKPNKRYSTNDFHVKLDSDDDDDDVMPKSEVLSKRKIEDDGINNNSNLIKRIKVDDNQDFEKAIDQLNFKSKENKLTKWVSLTPNNNEKEMDRKPHQNNVKANQRYSSDDLYKPRPTVGIRRRRGDTAL